MKNLNINKISVLLILYFIACVVCFYIMAPIMALVLGLGAGNELLADVTVIMMFVFMGVSVLGVVLNIIQLIIKDFAKKRVLTIINLVVLAVFTFTFVLCMALSNFNWLMFVFGLIGALAFLLLLFTYQKQKKLKLEEKNNFVQPNNEQAETSTQTPTTDVSESEEEN